MHSVSRREFLQAGGAGVLAAQAPRKIPVIDCHVHVGDPKAAAPNAEALSVPWTTAGVAPQEILRLNKEAGIDCSVIMPITPPGGTRFARFEKANEHIAEVCRKYPGKFIGFAKHDVVNEKGRLRSMLLREVRELGLRGLKMHQQPSAELLDACAELSIPVLYHPQRVALFEEVVAAYPKVNFMMAHMGRDEEPYARYVANRYPNAYLETANVVTTRHIERAVEKVPAGKIIFGSDEPLVDCRQEIFKIRVLKLPTEKEELILGGNLLRLLGGRIG
jgi:predicted TIM-barrel fold metal-dependent hydrolase